MKLGPGPGFSGGSKYSVTPGFMGKLQDACPHKVKGLIVHEGVLKCCTYNGVFIHFSPIDDNCPVR